MKRIILLLIATVVMGCSYSVYSSGYPHLKTISLPFFENGTTEYQLEETLQEKLTILFQKDGRLDIVSLSPDCILEGTIVDYTDKILTYDENGVDGYEVKILFSVTFTDMKKNKVMYQNSSLLLRETYSSSDESIQLQNEEQAQNAIFEELFEQILTKSLEEW